MSISPNYSVILFMIICFVIVAVIVTGIVLLVVYSRKGARPRPPVYQNPNPYQQNYYGNQYYGQAHQQHNNYTPHFDNHSATQNHATWGAADAFNNQDMNNEMNTHETPYSDKDHDGIPDQFDTHDNRFDSNFSSDSANGSDTNSWSGDSSSGSSDNSTGNNNDF